MARSAFNIIADVHEDMGQPGFIYCLRVLQDNDKQGQIDPGLKNAYQEFLKELEDLHLL